MYVRAAVKAKMEEQLEKLSELVKEQFQKAERQNSEEQERAAEVKGLLEKQMGAISNLSRRQEETVTFMNTVWSNLESVKSTVSVRLESLETKMDKESERFERRLEEQRDTLKSELKDELLRELPSQADSEPTLRADASAGEHECHGGRESLLHSLPAVIMPTHDAGRLRQRPSPFDGKMPWDVYHTQFELLAQLNGWSEGEKAAHLAVSLREDAATVLTNLPESKRQDYATLTSALECRFGTKNQIDLFRTRLRMRNRSKDEPLAGLAEDVERLVRLAYPEASESMVQVLAKDQFIDSLCDEEMRLRILQSKPSTLRDALQTALELESFQIASRQKVRNVREVQLQSGGKPTKHVSFADQNTTGLLQELLTAIQTLTTETRKRSRPLRPGNARADIVCWECNQKGHRQRECPTLQQGTSRSGNGS